MSTNITQQQILPSRPASSQAGRPTGLRSRLGQGWAHGLEVLRDEASQIRGADFVLFFLMVFNTHLVGTQYPTSQVVLLVIVLYGLTRKPLYDLGKYRMLQVLTFAFLGYLAVVTLTHTRSLDAFDWRIRLVRLCAVTLMMWFIADGRIHLRSALYGYATALTINIVLFYAQIAPDEYQGVLTGYLLDKNVSGMVYCLFGLLALSIARTMTARIIIAVIGLGAIWATDSRTSIAAYIFGIVWILLAPRIGTFLRLLLGLGIYGAANYLTNNYAQSGQFSSHAGSDWFREQIDNASLIKVNHTGPFGRGLGEAYVHLDTNNKEWFFHNSYWAALVEGGWPWLLLILGITIFVIIRPFNKQRNETFEQIILQGVGVAILICAWRLGEVFYIWQWAFIAGYAIRAQLISRRRQLLGDTEEWVGVDTRLKSTTAPVK